MRRHDNTGFIHLGRTSWGINLNKKFSALDVSDERHRVVDGHSACAVPFGHKGRQASPTRVSQRQIDDQVKMVLLQIVHDVPLFVFVGKVTLLLKLPVHSHHLPG